MGRRWRLLKAMPNPRLLEGRTAAGWTRRWMGSAAYETVWEPLLRGKFGDAAPEIAMPWFWARVHDRTQQLGYLRGGFQQLYDRLAEEVRRGRRRDAVRRVGHRGPDGRRRRSSVETDSGRRALRPRDQHLRATPDRAPRAGAAAGVAGSARVGSSLRRPLRDPGAGPAADIGLLAQHQRSRIPVHGARRAHELPAADRLRRAPPGLPGQLPADGRLRS